MNGGPLTDSEWSESGEAARSDDDTELDATLWDYWTSVWDSSPDRYYEWQARLMAERAPA